MNGIDLIELLKKKSPADDGFFSKPIAALHEFYITGTIEEAEKYVEWFDIIRHAGPRDIVKIYINSYGGDLFTAIQFLRVLTETEATKIVSVEGACMSAATVIFMAADSYEVTPHSVFMFHNYSGGAIGKGGEMIDQLLHERKWSENLLNEIYTDFLTPAEIKSMLDNKDIWMDGEEVVKRINDKLKREAELEKNAQEPAPIKRSRPATKSPAKKKTTVRK